MKIRIFWPENENITAKFMNGSALFRYGNYRECYSTLIIRKLDDL